MTDMKLLIVARDADAVHAYADTLSGISVAFDIALSFNAMSSMAI